ncbi:heliorhodopsin HeR [Nocardioides rubriscoriae]|uniref:heliorhodopsin HeR n=1 Tax=Nocardioides rubriscoriae TaxID=642762 RepID=UPI0011E04B86|nr:heliorhodopsin HeR [Nocardioides rubriscoriae]
MTTVSTTGTATGVDDQSLARLRRWNLGLTALHGVQAVLVLVLATDFSITVTSSFPDGPPGSTVPAPTDQFDVAIGPAIAVFLALAALDHLLTATVLRGRYEVDLRRGINRFRWVEYSISATIMVILIGFYNGVTGISAILAIAGANVAMILFGWLQESVNPPGRATVTMMPFWFGCLAGATPWVVIFVNLFGANANGDLPGFVWGIAISLFVFFMSFAANQYLQYRGIGRWASYAYGEKVYLVLSLVAKSALAWQIFGGSLAG